MRKSFAASVATLALLTASCGGGLKRGDDPPTTTSQPGAARETSERATTSDGPTPPVPAAGRDGVPVTPDISPDSAPDLAFGYSYDFAIAADRIAEVQQRHARECEALGAARCEVKGMTFRRNGGDGVNAELVLALEPGLAHRFGETALASVREAEGELVNNEVTGKDAGVAVRTATRTIDELEAQIAELETRIAAAGTANLRQTLQGEAAGVRARLRALRETRGTARAGLATTPVTMTYSSRAYLSDRPDFGGAAARAWSQLKWLGYGLFSIVLLLGPWALGLAAAMLVARAYRRRMQVPAD